VHVVPPRTACSTRVAFCCSVLHLSICFGNCGSMLSVQPGRDSVLRWVATDCLLWQWYKHAACIGRNWHQIWLTGTNKSAYSKHKQDAPVVCLLFAVVFCMAPHTTRGYANACCSRTVFVRGCTCVRVDSALYICHGVAAGQLAAKQYAAGDWRFANG
jgi:hypothetical protein